MASNIQEYFAQPNSLLNKATGGKLLTVYTLEALKGLIQLEFKTACVAWTDGTYKIILNIPWWQASVLWFRKKRLEAIVWEWIKEHDPLAKQVFIYRKSRNLAQEQAVLL
jgi:hypothetical protein